MPSPLEKRTVINAMRAADHQIEALLGNLLIVSTHLKKHGWRSDSMAGSVVLSAEQLKHDLDALHTEIFDEAIDRREDVPDDDVIEPRSGGGSKGGGG